MLAAHEIKELFYRCKNIENTKKAMKVYSLSMSILKSRLQMWLLEHGLQSWARRSIIHSRDIVGHRATFGQGLVQAHALESRKGWPLGSPGMQMPHLKFCRFLMDYRRQRLTGMKRSTRSSSFRPLQASPPPTKCKTSH